MKAAEAALLIAILATRVQVSEPKRVSALRYNAKRPEIPQLGVFPSSWRCEIDALEDEEWILDSCEESAMDEQEFYVFHGGMCKVFSRDLVASKPSLQQITCQRGRWTTSVAGSALDHPLHRHKRWWFVPIIIYAGCHGWGWWRWCSAPAPVVKKAPTYPANCTPSALKSVYYTPSGQEAMTITWDNPTPSDSDGSIKSNQQTSGTRKGELFDGLTRTGGLKHTIIYEARDNDGMNAFCTFSFAVQVRKCGPLLWPLYGRRDCSHDDTILGSTCSYDCVEGYTLANNISETTCSGEDDPQWSAEPFCEKVTCSTPPDVDDGVWTCDQGYEYDDYCVIECNDGYTLQGQVFTHCMGSGSWFWLRPTACIDDIAPELRCNTPQIFYTDWASTSASVVWELPSVTDNSGDNLTAIQTGGPDPGVSIPAGDSVYVTYVASDASNNQASPCEVEIRVEATNCGHPLDMLEDARLRFNCTTEPKYIYGDTCVLECAQSLPLDGTDLITCERNDTGVGAPLGYWDWGNGSMPGCSDIACATMKPPKNGALVFDWINGRPANTMQCNQEFTIPELIGFNGIFLCQDSGLWSPYYEKAPDCSERYSSRAFLLPSTFFYYEGVCGVNDTILENFEGIVSEMDTIFAALCPTGTVCETQNPQITCGETTRKKRETRKKRKTGSMTRKKRSTRSMTRKKRNTRSMHSVRQRSTSESEHTEDSPRIRVKRQTGPYLELTFDIAILFDTSQMTTAEIWTHVDYVQLDLLKPAVQTAVDNGTFDVPGWGTLYHFETSEEGYASCDPGSVVRGTTCIKCPPGHFAYDTECLKCVRGEYCETGGCPQCTSCPVGYSTREEASESLDNCTQLCEPGTYSPDTFVPCAECQAGLYQPDTGQTHCLTCPMGMSTKSMGSMTQADCQAYDVIVTDTGGYALVFDIPNLTNLAFEFFVKIVSGTPDIVASVDGELDVAIAETISVSTASTADDIGYPSDDTWIHVAIFWDATNGDLTAFYRDTLVVSHTSVFPTATPLGGSLYVSASGGSVAISGLRLRDSLLDEAGNMTATSCQNFEATDVINMEHLKYADGITLLVPSVCDAIDECSSSPCGEHSSKCKNIVDGFTCTCKGGWTGDTCDTPPDYCPGNNCQNGATCISGLTNYTCQCEPGFSGVSCQTVPGDGGWSVWVRWTECSLTCNTGSRERTRSCDSPVPDPHGQDCVGVDFETEDCNISPCPVCPDIESGSGAVAECEVDPDTGSVVCTAVCITEGYVQPPGLGNDTYSCGMETDYKWQPKKKIPGCVKPASPSSFTASTSASIDPAVPAEDEEGVAIGIASNMASTACAITDECNIDVQLGSAGSSRRRRNTGTTVTITYTIAINDTSDLQLDQYLQNGTVSPGLQEIIDAVESLEATTVAINDSAGTYFDVTNNGVTYTVDTSTITFDGGANCSDGQIVTNGLCAYCPAGSYQVGDYCSLCNKGTYQDKTGHAECLHCPDGYTTDSVGSDASTDCSVLETTAAPSTSSTTARQPGDGESGKGVLLIVIIVVSVLVGLIIGVIVIIVCIQKHNTGTTKIADSTPALQGSTPDLHGSTPDFHSSARADMHGMLGPVCNVPPMAAFIGKQAPFPPRPSDAVTVSDLDLDVDPFDEDD